jgi:hypothetical protein
MWLSKSKDGQYIVHKNEPEPKFIEGEYGGDLFYWSKTGDNLLIPEWLSVELCNKYNICRPRFEAGPINLHTHKSRTYSFSWWVLLTREWSDLKACLK